MPEKKEKETERKGCKHQALAGHCHRRESCPQDAGRCPWLVVERKEGKERRVVDEIKRNSKENSFIFCQTYVNGNHLNWNRTIWIQINFIRFSHSEGVQDYHPPKKNSLATRHSFCSSSSSFASFKRPFFFQEPPCKRISIWVNHSILSQLFLLLQPLCGIFSISQLCRARILQVTSRVFWRSMTTWRTGLWSLTTQRTQVTM